MKYLAIQIYEDGSETAESFNSVAKAMIWLWQENEFMVACKIERTLA